MTIEQRMNAEEIIREARRKRDRQAREKQRLADEAAISAQRQKRDEITSQEAADEAKAVRAHRGMVPARLTRHKIA